MTLYAPCGLQVVQHDVASDSGANAKLCQKDGWQTLVRSDASGFNSEEACVSYAAEGGTLLPAPCYAGSDDFEYAIGSQPTTFAGGTIDTAYGIFGGAYGLSTFPGEIYLDRRKPKLVPAYVHERGRLRTAQCWLALHR